MRSERYLGGILWSVRSVSRWADIGARRRGGFTTVAGFGRFHSTRHTLRIEFRRNRDKSLAQHAMAGVRVVADGPVHPRFNIRPRVGTTEGRRGGKEWDSQGEDR